MSAQPDWQAVAGGILDLEAASEVAQSPYARRCYQKRPGALGWSRVVSEESQGHGGGKDGAIPGRSVED